MGLLIADPNVGGGGGGAPAAHAASHATAGSDPITPASIGAATAAQGALADSSVQPNTTPTLSGAVMTGAITKATPGRLIGSSQVYAGIIGIRSGTNEIYVGDATTNATHALLGSIGFGGHIGVSFYAAGGIAWTDAIIDAGGGTRDLRLLRDSAGCAKFTGVSATDFRDLKIRDLIATQYLRPASYTVAAANALVGVPDGARIQVSNDANGSIPAFYRTGTGWLRYDNTAIST